MESKDKIFKQVLIALFGAIIIIQNFIPFLGYIPMGPLNLTIIHITALVFGTKYGSIIGGIWGVITFIRAFVWPTSPLAAIVFVNPLISILPRILIGTVAGWLFKFLTLRTGKKYLSMTVAAIAGSLVNTILVLGQIYLFYRGHSMALYHIDIQALLPYLLGVIATNGIPEAILAGILAPMIAKPLRKMMIDRIK